MNCLIIILSLFFTLSCSNDLEVINSIVASDTIPVLKIEEFYFEESENGKIKVTVKAPIVKRYETTKDTITLFPKGIEVFFYKEYPNVESMIKAKYAKHSQNKKQWEVKYNIVATNSKGDTLYTDLLYWDEKEHKVFSNKYSRIVTQDGTLIGRNGFESDENLSWWRVFNTQGVVNVKED
ncbi:MAG: LPS export ABC transporter periplasmic protein LptC [Bacteroidales bacterium]|nr:LPS export ABC transporter periplasmic protein LptC [Bacteroidales bacterium]